MGDHLHILLLIVTLFLFPKTMLTLSSSKGIFLRKNAKIMSRFVSENRVEAFNHAKASAVKMPCIVLVNPFLDANVGSISRSMLNFGMHELRVVNPRCDILSETAQTLAVGSVEILKQAKIFTSLEECLADLDIVVATTARKHSINQIVATPREMAAEAVNVKNNLNVGIMFGRERDGLNNEELALANRRVGIATFEHYGVLNMAQAVNIIGYECWQQALTVRNSIHPEQPTEQVITNSSDVSNDSEWGHPWDSKETERLATSGEVNQFLDRLLQNVGNSERNIHRKAELQTEAINPKELNNSADPATQVLDPDSNGVSGFTLKNEDRIKAVFRRANLNKREVRLLQGVVTRLVK